MTDEQLRIRVAELTNWEPEIVDVCYAVGHIHHELSEMPDYPGDLNAMHEAEKAMTEEQGFLYAGLLTDTMDGPWMDHKRRLECATATARQRAEAFVAVMEGKKE